MAEVDNNLEWKDRIDSDVRKLSERMAGVETGMEGLTGSFDRFIISFDASMERQRDMHKPQWQVIFGALTLAVIVLGGFISGYVRDLNRIESNVDTIRSHRMSAADPVQDGAIADLQAELLDIRTEEHLDMKRDAAGLERTRAIERVVFGKPGGNLHDAETQHGHAGGD